MPTAFTVVKHNGPNPDTFPTTLVPSVTAAHSVFTRLELAEEHKHKSQTHEVGHDRLRKKTHETHTRVFPIWASCSTCAATVLNSNGETSLSKWKPLSAETVWQPPQMPKLQQKNEPGLAVVCGSTSDRPPEVRYNNCLACPYPSWVMSGQNACVIEQFGPLVDPLHRM